MSSMDLLCCENGVFPEEVRAYIDPNLLNDDRVLDNLLKDEACCPPFNSYFDSVQHQITPEMRKIVADWMWEVCEEHQCQEDVFALAMNYLDRFLSIVTIKKTQLQLLGVACLLISSKLRETIVLKSETLVALTSGVISLQDLKLWEMLVLSKLKWDMTAVLPHDFVYYLVKRIDDSLIYNYPNVQKHAHFLITLCIREFKFNAFSPCTIAAGCIAAALDGLDWLRRRGISMTALEERLHQITRIDKDVIQNCTDEIQYMVSASIALHIEMKNQAEEDKAPDLTTFPATPPDVTDASHLNF